MEYFIGETYIRKFLNKNIDWSIIEPLIKGSALTYLRPLLGFRFFNDLLDKYNDNSYTFTTREEELIKMIKYIQGLRVKYESVYEISYQSSNKGYVNQTGDFMNSLTLNELQELRNDLNRKITDEENVMISFINFYDTDFPLFEDSTNKEITKPVNKGGQNNGENFDII